MKPFKKALFGELNGAPVHSYTLTNDSGTSMSVIDLGAAITHLFIADKDGKSTDIVLAYKTVEEYADNTTYFGAFVGRVANRIIDSTFEIDGVTYNVDVNMPPHSLHGGFKGYSFRILDVEAQDNSLTFTFTDPDGTCGFPGTLDCTVYYELTEDNKIIMRYNATCDKKSIINLTNHSYFNLNGHNAGDIYDHVLRIDADRFTENEQMGTPTGIILDVEGTPHDFRVAKPIGQDINGEHPQVAMYGGYDNNFIINDPNGGTTPITELYSPKSGIGLKVYTTKPAIQLYTSNMLKPVVGKDEAQYKEHCALCLETQFCPGARPFEGFCDITISPEKPYKHETVYELYVK